MFYLFKICHLLIGYFYCCCSGYTTLVLCKDIKGFHRLSSEGQLNELFRRSQIMRRGVLPTLERGDIHRGDQSMRVLLLLEN